MIPRVQYTPVPGKFNDRPQTMRNTLYLNRGHSVFSEIANFAGVAASDWAWCPMFIDVDLDGFEDILITNGVERNARHLDTIIKLRKQRESRTMTNREILLARKVFPAQNTANVAFRNLGNLKFAKAGSEWGFDTQGVSHGMASGDLDGDGDLDAWVSNGNEPGHPNRVWTNDGFGNFSNSNQALGSWSSASVALGDLDDDVLRAVRDSLAGET